MHEHKDCISWRNAGRSGGGSAAKAAQRRRVPVPPCGIVRDHGSTDCAEDAWNSNRRDDQDNQNDEQKLD